MFKRPAFIMLMVSLVIGWGTVAWRAHRRTAETRAQVIAEARAAGFALELQLNEAISAVEVLVALATSGDGRFPDFQRTAADLLATRPGVAALHLLPGGVLRESAPRAGNTREIGWNMLQDPWHRTGVNAAMKKRTLTMAGPVRFPDGQLGITVLAPVFPRQSVAVGGFWGFVAASLRLSEAFARAQGNELAAKGYDYRLLAQVPGQEKPILISQSREMRLSAAIQQPIQSRNFELRLVLQPRGGWTTGKLALDGGLVVVLSGLLWLLSGLWTRYGELEQASSAAARQLAQEAEERKSVQEQFRFANETAAAADTELKHARASLEQAQSGFAELRTRLEEGERRAKEAQHLAEARQKNAEARAGELETQLDARIRAMQEATQAHRKELAEVQGALEQSRQTVVNLHTRLETATRGERELKSRLLRAEARITELTGQLAEALAQGAPARDKSTARAEDVMVPANRAGEPSQDPPGEGVAPADMSEEYGDARQDSDGVREEGASGKRAAVDVVSTTPLTSQPWVQPSENTGVVDPIPQPLMREKPVEKVLETEPKEHKTSHHVRPLSPTLILEFRKAVHQIVPLLTDGDPGAKDCLKDNRGTFRSAFPPETYGEFEQFIKDQRFSDALDLLKKVSKKHSVTI